ncbi:hypothetical protein [Nocardiopsis sp. NPDC058789]|uniref:hypothetical protein n=1 Tax=Nocardiopsis TaxID=2013 RepID=UPI00366D8026
MTEHPASDSVPIPGSVPLPGFGPVPRVPPAPEADSAEATAPEAAPSQAAPGQDPAPEVRHLAATLRRRRSELADARAARIGDGSIVHELTTRVWVGVEIPAVVCAAADDPMRLRPSTSPVTCLRCRSRRSGSGGEQVPGQALLWG